MINTASGGTLERKKSGFTLSKWLPNRETRAAWLFLAPFMAFFLVFTARAVINSGFISLHDWEIMAPTHPFVGFKNYVNLFNDSLWWLSLKNTLVFAILTVVGNTVVSMLAALAVNNPIRGQTFFRVVFYAPVLLSVGVVGLIWGWLFNGDFGVLNYILHLLGLNAVQWLGGDGAWVIPALSITSIWWGFGYPMLIFLAGLQNIPEALYEAARIDGANGRQLTRFITLPLLRPTILFVTVTQFIAHFQMFGQTYIMSRGGPGRSSYSVIYYLYQVGWNHYRMGYASAIAITLAAIIVVLTLIQFRFLGSRTD
jgi:multiple sugar transport system permease protein